MATDTVREMRRPESRRARQEALGGLLRPRRRRGGAWAVIALQVLLTQAGASQTPPAAPLPNLEALETRLGAVDQLAGEGQFGVAAERLRALIRACPQSAALHHNLAVLLAAQADYDGALEVLRQSPGLLVESARLVADLRSLQGLTVEQPQLVDDTIRLELVDVEIEEACTPEGPPPMEVQTTEEGEAGGAESSGSEDEGAGGRESGESSERVEEQGESVVVEKGDVASGPGKQDLEASVRAKVGAWVEAWSSGDSAAYLSHYAADFPRAGDRASWEARRRAALQKEWIRIAHRIEWVELGEDGASATVRFFQAYASNDFSDNGFTTLELERQGDRWEIVGQTFEDATQGSGG